METYLSNPALLVLLSAGLAGLPLCVAVLTSYLKISIVLGILRSALGTQQVPSNLVIAALALTLSFYIMRPVASESWAASKAFDSAKIKDEAALLEASKAVLQPWMKFLERHAGKREIQHLKSLIRRSEVTTQIVPLGDDLETLLPAFILTELKEAFSMAFLLLLPFLVIDLAVANILVGMGMFMVSPVMISLPLKLMLFVACDAWLLIAKGLIVSYR